MSIKRLPISYEYADESNLGNRNPLILKQAKKGNIQAISVIVGVSRQSIYRWKKEGMTVTLENVIRKQREMVGGRGRPIGSSWKRRIVRQLSRSVTDIMSLLKRHTEESTAGNASAEHDISDLLQPLLTAIPKEALAGELAKRSKD